MALSCLLCSVDLHLPLAPDFVSPFAELLGAGYPSGAGDCVAMTLPSGHWVDMSCGTVLPYLCEEKLYGGSTLVTQVRAASARTCRALSLETCYGEALVEKPGALYIGYWQPTS